MSTDNLKINEIIARMCSALGVDNTVKLAESLGYKSTGTISGWKKNKSIPDSAIAKVSDKSAVKFEWIKYGQGEMRLDPPRSPILQDQVNEAQAEYKNRPIKLTQQEFILVTLFRQCGKQWQEDIISTAALGAADSAAQ